jgi:glycosyltransferase involved in cell wall biosynthesis
MHELSARSRDSAFGVVVTVNFPLPVTSGGRKRAARLLEAMQRAGVTPHILTIEEVSRDARDEAAARGWRVEVAPAPPGVTRLRRHLHAEISPFSATIVRRLEELAFAAAFVQLEEIGAAQYAGHVTAGTPLIASLHNVDSKARTGVAGGAAVRLRAAYRRSRMAAVERRCVERATATFAVSEADAAHFHSSGGGRVHVVPNGVDPEFFEVSEGGGDPISVLFFGQLCYRPNLEGITRFVRESWPRVLCRLPAARLRIAGPSAPASLHDLASAVPGVELLGFVDDLTAELRRAGAVVVPIWSGGGTRIKVLEALAAARPVVGTSLGVEQIGFADGVHGLVADSDDGLAEKLCAVLDDPLSAARFGANGRDLARGYEWEQTTAPAERLYRELAGEPVLERVGSGSK